MTDLLERLGDANPVHTNDLAPPVEDVWRKLDGGDVPQHRRLRTFSPKRRRLTRWATVGLAALAAAISLLIVGTTGGGPASAFAGWTADPTRPVAGQLQAAEAACARDPSLASLTPTLSDTRGPFSMFIYAQAATTASCISGQSSPTVIGQIGTPQIGAPSTSSVPRGAIEPQGGIVNFNPGQDVRFLIGQVGPDVTGVTLVLDDGSSVEATTENGWFAAWWPSLQGVQSADVTTATGSSTQQLNVPTATPAPALTRPDLPAGPTPQGASSPSGNAGTPATDATGTTN